MRKYRVIVHRTVILEEEWAIFADDDAQARAGVLRGDGDYKGETTLECLEESVASSRRVAHVDPDIDVDEGL